MSDTGSVYPKRHIGDLSADVTIEEVSNDELAITQHPVEKSADITDHAYSLPARLQVRVGYAPNGGKDLQTIYDQYLVLKNARTLLEVQTGKRLYENMLIRSITLVTDAETENALFLAMELQEVILVETQTVAVPANNAQKQPQKTANSLNSGTKNAAPMTNPPTTIAGEPIDPKYLQ